jgi:hypothetical protein
MTNEEIKQYFGELTVYVFEGKLDELKTIMQEAGTGYNILVVGKVYFVCPAQNCPTHEKISEIE